MTRKDFQLIADVLREHTPGQDYDQFRITVNAMADALATTNPRFDRAAFLKACGL